MLSSSGHDVVPDLTLAYAAGDTEVFYGLVKDSTCLCLAVDLNVTARCLSRSLSLAYALSILILLPFHVYLKWNLHKTKPTSDKLSASKLELPKS